MKRSGTVCLLLLATCGCSNQPGTASGATVPVEERDANGQGDDLMGSDNRVVEDPKQPPVPPVIEPSPLQPPAEVDPVLPPVEGTEPKELVEPGNRPTG